MSVTPVILAGANSILHTWLCGSLCEQWWQLCQLWSCSKHGTMWRPSHRNMSWCSTQHVCKKLNLCDHSNGSHLGRPDTWKELGKSLKDALGSSEDLKDNTSISLNSAVISLSTTNIAATEEEVSEKTNGNQKCAELWWNIHNHKELLCRV